MTSRSRKRRKERDRTDELFACQRANSKENVNYASGHYRFPFFLKIGECSTWLFVALSNRAVAIASNILSSLISNLSIFHQKQNLLGVI